MDHKRRSGYTGGSDVGGRGYAQFRVMDMIGKYYFYGAVLMSILLSLVVDWLDERDRGSVEEDLLDRKRELEFILPGNNGGGGGGNELELREESSLPPLNEAFLSDDDPIASQSMNRESGLSPVGTATSYARLDRNASIRTLIPSPSTNCRLLKQAMLIFLAVILHVFLGLPVAFDCMERPIQRTTLRMVLYQVVSTLWRGLLPIIDALGAFCCWGSHRGIDNDPAGHVQYY